MKTLLTQKMVSMTELKASPSQVLEQANGTPVAVFNRNKAVGYFVPAEAVEAVEPISYEDVLAAMKKSVKKNAVAIDNLKDR